MKKGKPDNIKAFGCLLLLVPMAMMINGIPWWSFVIVVSLFGFIITIRKWKVAAFSIGFLSGLVVWTGANLYYHTVFGGSVFEKLGQVMFIPEFVVFLLSGVIGGLLTGLALYTGKSAVKQIGEEI
jgi:hypothetical protein